MSVATTKTMRRRSLLKGAAALGALAALGTPGFINATETEAAGSSLVGVWMVTDKGRGDVDLSAFTNDGLMIDAGSVSLKAPAPSNNTPNTIGLGSWAPAASGGYDLTFVGLIEGKDGALQGTKTISAHATLSADGDTFHAPYKGTFHAGGKVVFTVTGSVTGTRIKPAM
jgi:hypothetical protein